ncbi:DUF1045 domain-containing protein [Dyella nitratireducens]|uniref:Phosphonate metabolism protein n=1 Tax=Dyella nitratireducens TaxID=1849580 RepID=A0ABQ1FSN7_9GAMM|nr:DUF1045 domain-containing protein [Dyella nitratireducens]GGA28142.1 phosphonate metabolism protein [Dyella nitratireducens]GLQ43322.1 phosphonate metabolism protein [Dyella nitratireducens]
MRYAVYFCPAAGSELEAFGREWLSTDAVPGVTSERLRVLTSNVRRYGWHATLCAPFALAEQARYDDVRENVADIAQRTQAFEFALHLDRLAGFLALRPSAGETPAWMLAERCVRRLNALRAPVTDEAWQRKAVKLDAVERSLFRQFGYPYVLDRYRFHMTLCAPASEEEESALQAWLSPWVASLPPARIDAMTICREAEPGQPFEQIERFPFGVGLAA